MNNIPSPDVLFPNAYHTSCFLKNAISAPNIFVGDYTYYDDPVDPTAFERNNVPAYTLAGGNPAREIRKRFDPELTELLLELRWWDFEPASLAAFLPVLCSSDLEAVRAAIRQRLGKA